MIRITSYHSKQIKTKRIESASDTIIKLSFVRFKLTNVKGTVQGNVQTEINFHTKDLDSSPKKEQIKEKSKFHSKL